MKQAAFYLETGLLLWMLAVIYLFAGPLLTRSSPNGAILTTGIALLAGYTWVRIRGLEPVSSFGLGPTKGMRKVILVTVLAGSVVLIALIDRMMVSLLSPPDEFARLLSSSVQIGSIQDGFGVVMRIVIVAPVVEEMIFRGLLLQHLKTRLLPTGAVAISAIVFALFHPTPWQYGQLVLLGLIAGYLTIRCSSIYPAVALHAGNNLLAVIALQE
ncbi:MAG: CPBP family intramembrane metalloprotease [Calditrichaeota bacterium]|nr:CPBP family intramembrane metalloprotease [Calditrichota bacterium]